MEAVTLRERRRELEDDNLSGTAFLGAGCLRMSR
jgi:hypothetical protein